VSTAPWLPYPLVLACSADCRSPECLRQTLAQFDVEHDERYQPGSFSCPGTRCNIFLWDCTRALECEIPHWVGARGACVPPGTAGARELSAAGMIGWLKVFGSDHGWYVVAATSARMIANGGRPCVATWENPDREHPSHVAMLLPTPDIDPHPRIAQAGLSNLYDVPLPRGFAALQVQFWAHE
jgi:hypothetical protein